MFIYTHWVTKITLAGLSLDLDDPLRSGINPWMMRLQIHKFLFVSNLFQACQFSLFKMDLILHELLYWTDVVLYYVLVSMDVS